MAFTATIDSIIPQDDGSGQAGVNFFVAVTFRDSVSLFITVKNYVFPATTSQATAVAQITSDGNSYKTKIATISNLQAKIGTVLTI